MGIIDTYFSTNELPLSMQVSPLEPSPDGWLKLVSDEVINILITLHPLDNRVHLCS